MAGSIETSAASTTKSAAPPLRLTKEDLIPRKFRLVRRKELAAFIMTDEMTIRAFHDHGIIQYARDMDGNPLPGKYDLYDATQAIMLRERKERTAKKGTNQQLTRELEIAKLQGVKASVEQKIIQNTIIFGNLYRRDDVIHEWDDMILAIRSHFMDFPWHLATKVLGHEDFQTVVKIIQAETERCMSDLAGMNEEMLKKIADRDKKNSKLRADLESGDASGLTNEFDSSNAADIKISKPVGRPKKT